MFSRLSLPAFLLAAGPALAVPAITHRVDASVIESSPAAPGEPTPGDSFAIELPIRLESPNG